MLGASLSISAARGAVEATADTARVALPAPAFAFAGDSNTVFLWIYREPATGTRSILEIPGAISLLTSSDGDAIATISYLVEGRPQTLQTFVTDAIPENEWSLVTISIDEPTGEAMLAVESTSLGMRSHVVQAGGPFSAGPVSGDATVGSFGGYSSMRGVFGIVVVRNHSVTLADAQGLFALRHHFGPYERDTLTEGGRMNGISGVRWMINHGVFIEPWNGTGVFGLTAAQLAAKMDEPARTTDFHVYTRMTSIFPTSFRVVRPVTEVASMTYRSPFERDPGFFVRRLPEFSADFSTDPVPAIAPMARRLAERAPPTSGPPIRVVVSANSRGVRQQDGTGQAGGFAHGFTLATFEDNAGIFLRPVRISNVGPYFGLRTSSGADFQPRRSPDALPIELTNLARLFTGGPTTNAEGPGTGITLIQTGSYYGLRCQPEPGSRLTADRPLTVRAYVLEYPNAPTVQIAADAGHNQSEPGAQTVVGTVDLNTAIPSLDSVVSAVDSDTEFLVPGNLTAGPTPLAPGMGCTLYSSGSRGSVSIVQSVRYESDTARTRIVLEIAHDFAFEVGSTMRFGPVGIRTVEHTHGPAIAGFEWRGLELTRTSDANRSALVIFAYDAFNPDDGGFAFAPAGWSGRGYDAQLDSSFDSSHHKWIAAAEPDLWLEYIAHQQSNASSMERMRQTIAQASPTTQIAWVGCVEFEDGDTHESWHRYILENAKASGVPGLTVFDHPLTGSFFDGAIDGAFVAGNHLTARGNRAIANATLDVLKTAARWPGDANNDARVDFADLNILLSNFGASGANDGSLAGDVTLDGFVDFTDLNAVLSNFGSSVFD